MMRSEMPDLLALVRPIEAKIRHLTFDARITLLMCLITNQICTLPPGDRQQVLDDMWLDFPQMLDGAQTEMRRILAINARKAT